MSRIIAGMYELQEQIGSGGGGIVYLGRHLRLNKKIVLKADKRTLTTKQEVLRREVDMLKGLSHTYIPQVYDFVQENGVVYTVMDFIEGESFDKILSRGEYLEQAQVIQWACELLEALKYLHSRPPHGILHGDIKPANIMLRPNGTICLIDYNIALVLSEDGAVKVGASRGYASPEHYGTEFGSKEYPYTESVVDTETIRETETMTDTANEKGRSGEASEKSTAVRRRGGVMLDVRSDIYSLGATLYHLLSGQRPSQNAGEVVPLGADVCSPAVSAIIQKAMALDPDQRYQTAEEMLVAFRQLHKRDKRMLRHKWCMVGFAVVCVFTFLTGGACTFLGLNQMEQRQEALALAEYSANEYEKGNISKAVELALKGIPEGKRKFSIPVPPQVQKALTDALGVYDLSDGFQSLDMLELPSAPFKLAVSPQGGYLAVLYAGEAAIYDLSTLQKIDVLSMQDSALSDLIFTDEKHLVYAGEKGVTAYDLDTGDILWTGDQAVSLSVSGDGTTVAAVDGSGEFAMLYRMSDGMQIQRKPFHGLHLYSEVNDIFADPDNHILALNQDGTLLAASFSDGSLIIYNLENPDEDLILYETSDYIDFSGGFSGKYFAFLTGKTGENQFGLIDTEEAVYLGGYASKERMQMQADERGIFLSRGNILIRLDPVTQEEQELAYTDHENMEEFFVGAEYTAALTDQNQIRFFDRGANVMDIQENKTSCDFLKMTDEFVILANRNEPAVRILKRVTHPDADLFSYDPRDVHDEARISQDGKTVMLFDFQGFRIYDKNGTVVSQMVLPESDRIYDQQFVREEESWMEVIWYDGTVRRYDASDGHLIDEKKGEPPSEDLYEEFFTDQYRITSSLHSAPVVYDRKNDQQVAVLEEDSYLTYVTEIGEYLVTEYVRASGERYGLLLDESLETVAYLPGLCDVVNGMFIFDYETGNLRQCRLYSLQELRTLGERYLKKEKRKE
ncbi:MAG: protein kinase [Brotaphodocola sp.]